MLLNARKQRAILALALALFVAVAALPMVQAAD